MATLTREISLFLDSGRIGGADCILDGASSVYPVLRPSLMAGDKCTISLYFRVRSATNGTSTGIDLPAGAVVVLSGRASTGDELFNATPFTASGSGDTKKYSAVLDLSGADALSAVSSVAYGGSIDVYIDVEIQDATNSERMTYRAAVKLYRQIYGP